MKRKRRRRCKFRIVLFLITILMILFISARIIDKSLKPIVNKQGEIYAHTMIETGISKCVSEFINNGNYTYTDFTESLYDINGNISSIEANTAIINSAQAELTKSINNELMKTKYSDAEIPIGSLTNSYILAGKGIKIPLRICPIGKTNVKLESSFTSAGINQTCHKISAIINVETQSAVPFYKFRTKNEFEFLITETIIIGEIPQNNFVKAW